ncbi:hypothetical protein NPIL_380121 [Nephila pilipes]|uniref:Uncharacterized protein n=1 Tax=Nephila pilipes TaxID=299642 RepID=A0A8X6UEA2_NEPPI|nr:hypothetical protein NPIL_380121 [Nephila pilipes]
MYEYKARASDGSTHSFLNRQCPYAKIVLHLRIKEIETEIKRLLEANIIKPSLSPHAAPVALVMKKDEGKLPDASPIHNQFYSAVHEARTIAFRRTLEHHEKNKFYYDSNYQASKV